MQDVVDPGAAEATPVEPPQLDDAGEPPALPPISGFWRRLAAFLVDTVVLGAVGQALGWSLSSVFFGLGPWGRLVGWAILLVYLTVSYAAGQGQTVGKLALGIAVRNELGEPVGWGIALARAALLTVPALFNGWHLSLFQEVPVLSIVPAVAVFGLGGSLLHTMVFNRGTGQGVHDLICGTHVVRVRGGEPVAEYPVVWPGHLVVVAVVVVASLAIGGLSVTGQPSALSWVVEEPDWTAELALHEVHASDDRCFGVGVVRNGISLPGKPSVTSPDITARHEGPVGETDVADLQHELAATALERYRALDRADDIGVSVEQACDVLLASGHRTASDRQKVEAWQSRMASP